MVDTKVVLTALPEVYTFRQSSLISSFCGAENHKLVFVRRMILVRILIVMVLCDIHHIKLSKLEQNRLWLNRNYYDILCRLALDKLDENEDVNEMIEELAKRYGKSCCLNMMRINNLPFPSNLTCSFG